MSASEEESVLEGVAVIGMAGRFPGAENIDAFWSNLLQGVDSISHFDNDELEPSLYELETVRSGDNYVRSRGIIPDVDKFDAGFFRFTPREAAGMDPQHRVFLEVASAALENAGCDPARYEGLVGVWAGMNPNSYLWENVLPHAQVIGQSGIFPVILNNDKDYLATRVSYKLDLRGPSITLQTACSTGLVVVHNAVHSLLSYQCDIAVAGASSISVPQKRGYVYQEGAIGSRDGKCRPFDAEASGTVFSDGVGVVVLKRLADALADGDTIYAVVKGSALNNDGARKAGFTAPSVDGQAEAIAMAQAMAGFEPDTISYVETHGTATPLGDPIEIAGLTKAFRSATDKTGFCSVGSVKGNIGHLDAAAGIAGFIKTALALHHQQIPPSLHYSAPNPQIDFASSPFVVNAALRGWPSGATPRRAGVSSFGIGGTNAHAVLEEAPPKAATKSSRAEQLLVLSAKTAEALSEAASRLAHHLREHPDVALHDVAHTLQEGRQAFTHRLAVIAGTPAEAADALDARDGPRTIKGMVGQAKARVAFMFPGQGSQYVGMGAELYKTEPAFRQAFDACADAFTPHLGCDIRELVYPASEPEAAASKLAETINTQPAMFAIEYALARLLMSWGINPDAMIGHSIGEYTAACLAGTLSLEDLGVIAARARLMQQQPRGSMLAVRMAASALEPILPPGVSIAAYNAPELTVASGTIEAIADFQKDLEARGGSSVLLATSHAFHSAMMDGALEPFMVELTKAKLTRPNTQWISCLTGDLISDEQATSPSYWTQQLRQAVRFSDGVQRLRQTEGQLLLEVGPGSALTSLARQHGDRSQGQRVIATLGNDKERGARALLEAVGRLWVQGAAIDWTALRSNERRQRVPLPTYPFARTRHWMDPPVRAAAERVLPAVETTQAQPQATELLPSEGTQTRDEMSSRVWALLSGISGIPEVDIDGGASFVDLGLDSLLLTQVATAIERQFDLRIALPQLLGDYATPERLARHVAEVAHQRAEPATANGALPTVAKHQRTGDIPLSFAQRRLWFMDRLEGPNAIYVIPLAVRLRGSLDRAALQAALHDVVERHESLRTIYPEDAGTPRQEILESFRPSLTEEAVSEADLPAAMAVQCQRGFDLLTEPPLRTHLLSLAPDDAVLLLQIHHIAGDGFSLMALAKDLSAAYEARCRGQAPRLPELPLQYADFAANQVALLGTAETSDSLISRQITFWKEALIGLPEEIELPRDRLRPAVASYRGDRMPLKIGAPLHQRILELAAETQSSVFMVLQAALAALLTRLGAGHDVPVGSPIAGRTDKSLNDLVGCFVNMLVLRTDTSGDPSFRELISRVRSANFAGYANQDLPFERLVEVINPERSLARHPLFQVMLAFLNTTRIEFEFPGIATSLLPVNTGTSQYDLSFYLNERRAPDGSPQGVEGLLEYSTDLFDTATAGRLTEGLIQLLTGAVAAPDAAFSSLQVISPPDLETLLKTWNATDAAFPEGGIHTLFERQAERTPDHAAVVFGSEQLTYRELEEHANRIAQTLRSSGVAHGHRVGFCLDRGRDMLPALLGILKTGACYVPLDPGFPRERLDFMVENADLTFLVGTAALVDSFEFPRNRQLRLDTDRELIAAAPVDRPTGVDAAVDTQPAYILYTSGSTGKPKGVVVPHSAVVNFLTSMAKEPGLAADDKLLAITTLSFDIAVLELYLPLIVGATVVLATREDATDGEALSALVRQSGATVMQGTPASWRILIDAGWRATGEFKALVGGEALPKRLAGELLACGVELWNMYGPTETTVWSTCAQIKDAESGITIGKPIANTSVHILGEQGELVPIGAPGELCIGGDGVALGYWNLPELTAERFITNRYGAAPGDRLYRTGDRARWRSDGTLEHCGRLDNQVKVRGFRIELGEIEALLSEHPDVRQAAVRLHQVNDADVRILAYYIPAKAGVVSGSALRKHVRTRLPEYMIPQSIMPIDALPLTPNGKIDRRRLPLPPTTQSRRPLAQKLSDPTEITIAEIWTALTAPTRAIEASDRFFEIGGHSLLALQAVRQIESKLGTKLDLRTLFQENLGEIAARCRKSNEGRSPLPAMPKKSTASKPLSSIMRLLRASSEEPSA